VALEELEGPRFVGTAEKPPVRGNWQVEAAVVLVAIAGHLPALGAWWNLDDWGLLGRAAGMVQEQAALGFPARWLSQHLYWSLTYPLFGTASDPYTWTRLLLHGMSAWLVTRIAMRAGLAAWPRLVAGLMLAATPLAFTPLYWAAGIQELLAAFLALLAVERWLAAGRANLALAVLAASLSMLAKESGLGLPVLFLTFLWLRMGVDLEDKAFGWALTLLLLGVAVVEGTLVSNHFATGSGDPYAIGGARDVVLNLGVFGWWLLSPGPLLASTMNWPMTAAGVLFFLGWAVWAVNQALGGKNLPGLTLLAALLVIGPALGLKNQLHPYLGYLAVAPMGLAIGSLVPGRWRMPLPALVAAALLAGTWSYWSMDTRLGQRDAMGLPADPVVRATSLSWKVCRELKQLPLERGQTSIPALTLLQIPATDEAAEMAGRLGDRWVAGTHLYEAIGGTVGPRLILQDRFEREVRVDWANALFTCPGDALVLCASGPGFKHWGTTANATFYAALTDVAMGRFDRARKHLIRAGKLHPSGKPGNDQASFFYDPGQMIVPMSRVLERKEEFIDWTLSLLGQEHSAQEVGGLQEMFMNLLAIGTGQTVEQLTAGSRLLENLKEQIPESKPTGE
jgi:hypothetical protein